ncbi:glycosyltransferase family 4 protein [Crenobacter sp. SG2305]|uniref:glycosyltransferase family 4 protein n=1 Tax=Crenobacter oryzisoli TaxID=3056844 RepID=UPI0025AA776D|nr:glycosyltransferase family 4 protein [Crenobacter sp. SG2305]MDN0083713.1 glycosyltransferase family 4 protein [Crenobacter sp. SG2305]
MKIGIACNAFGYSGGFERYALDLVNGLQRMGITPTFFARRFDTALAEYRMIEPVEIKVGWLPGKLRDGAFSRALEKKKARHGIELLIGCNRNTASDVAVCGGTHRGYLAASGKAAGFWDSRQIALEERFYANARRVIAHSALMAKELTTLYQVPATKLATLYPPVSGERFVTVDDEQRRALRRRFGLPDDKVVFVFPSSSHQRKGLPVLRAAFERSGLPVLLAVVGRPLDKPGRNLIDLGYQKHIEQLYQAADYTILASSYEPFGLVGIESALCGTPLVLADNIACTEVLSDAACLRFDREQPATLEAALAEAVRRVGAGAARLAEPRREIRYDADVTRHVEQLLACAGLR